MQKNETGQRLKICATLRKKQKAGLCGHYGCQAKLIPRELLPPWASVSVPVASMAQFKAFQIIDCRIQYIMDHSLTPEKARDAMLQKLSINVARNWFS